MIKFEMKYEIPSVICIHQNIFGKMYYIQFHGSMYYEESDDFKDIFFIKYLVMFRTSSGLTQKPSLSIPSINF